MIPELGFFALLLGLGLALQLMVLPFAGVFLQNRLWVTSGPFISMGIVVFSLFSLACLGAAFLNDDFSVRYVASNSNSLLPWYYKLSAVWGGHEGSFLLWTVIMAVWTFAVGLNVRSLPEDFAAWVLSVMGFLLLGFFSFLVFVSNPFTRALPMAPPADLNPLLQDFGLIVHPPMLYLGYVGFAVPFAFAVAALASGRLDTAWARWSRPWTNLAWAFLTLGILLGSWWAYYELGWGGWWFWDPVENASFMPWLVGTALIHSLAVTEKRGLFRSWTVLLAIFTFSLSLLGAFLVRSGVLTSVHAFAVDPARGIFILVFLCLTVGGALALYALRAGAMASRSGSFGLISRETFLLLNNLLLTVAAGSVLLGTLSPLAYEALSGGARISVGPPYFNLVFVPLALLLLIALIPVPASQWKNTQLGRLRQDQYWMAPLALVLGIFWNWLAGGLSFLAVLTVCLAIWVLLGLLVDWGRPWVQKRKAEALLRSPSTVGMWLGHAGLAVAAIGLALTSWYSLERDLLMRPGDEARLGSYRFVLTGVREVQGPNYLADEASLTVFYKDRELTRLAPQKRRYLASGMVMTEAAIDVGWLRDIYVAMGEPLPEGAFAMRLQYKPFVRWIWFGAFLAALGGVTSLFDRRYRQKLVRTRPAAEGSG